MRWKTVASKNFARASETMEAPACGAVLGSSATVKSPQLVLKVSDFLGRGGALGFFSRPGLRGCGPGPCWQPPAVVGGGVWAGAAAGADELSEDCLSPPPPQP